MIKLSKLLIEECNADPSICNKYGANVMHVAAQGDQPVSLYYFWSVIKMSCSMEDQRGSTPLHWACYSKAENAQA